jgi:hypothetical protein
MQHLYFSFLLLLMLSLLGFKELGTVNGVDFVTGCGVGVVACVNC